MNRFSYLAGALALLITALGATPGGGQQRGGVIDGVDKFVLTQFDRIQPKSIRENRTYCGLVGFDSQGELSVTPARPGEDGICRPDAAPAGFDVIASYRTLGAFKGMTGGELPSARHLEEDFAQNIDGYVATPGGRVWLHIAAERLTFQVCGRGCVPSDKTARACKKFLPKIEYTILQLKQIEAKAPGPC